MTFGFMILKTLIIALIAATLISCSGDEKMALKPVEDLLKQNGVKEVALDLLLTAPDIPNKAYVSVTATYGFASSSGSVQKEFSGYIVRKDGTNWRIEKNVIYTKDKQVAREILSGKEK